MNKVKLVTGTQVRSMINRRLLCSEVCNPQISLPLSGSDVVSCLDETCYRILNCRALVRLTPTFQDGDRGFMLIMLGTLGKWLGTNTLLLKMFMFYVLK